MALQREEDDNEKKEDKWKLVWEEWHRKAPGWNPTDFLSFYFFSVHFLFLKSKQNYKYMNK